MLLALDERNANFNRSNLENYNYKYGFVQLITKKNGLVPVQPTDNCNIIKYIKDSKLQLIKKSTYLVSKESFEQI